MEFAPVLVPGCVFYFALRSIPGWFSRYQALATGTVTNGSSLGGVMFPIVTNRLLPEVGFPWNTRVSAFLILVFACRGESCYQDTPSSVKEGKWDPWLHPVIPG